MIASLCSGCAIDKLNIIYKSIHILTSLVVLNKITPVTKMYGFFGTFCIKRQEYNWRRRKLNCFYSRNWPICAFFDFQASYCSLFDFHVCKQQLLSSKMWFFNIAGKVLLLYLNSWLQPLRTLIGHALVRISNWPVIPVVKCCDFWTTSVSWNVGMIIE